MQAENISPQYLHDIYATLLARGITIEVLNGMLTIKTDHHIVSVDGTEVSLDAPQYQIQTVQEKIMVNPKNGKQSLKFLNKTMVFD